jgi:hypothetical protein
MKPTPRILALQKQFFNQYKQNKKTWVKKYGADAEKIMTGAAFKRAESAAMKENKQRIKEMVTQALLSPTPTRSPKKENPEDIIKMDVPLLIRMLEYAKEDAETDMDLHKIAENLILLSKKGRVLDMEDYDSIISPDSEI